MNDTKELDNLNPSGFKSSVEQTEIRLIDVTKMIPIVVNENPPSAFTT